MENTTKPGEDTSTCIGDTCSNASSWYSTLPLRLWSQICDGGHGNVGIDWMDVMPRMLVAWLASCWWWYLGRMGPLIAAFGLDREFLTLSACSFAMSFPWTSYHLTEYTRVNWKVI